MRSILFFLFLGCIRFITAKPGCDGQPLSGILGNKSGNAYALFVGVNAPGSGLDSLEHPANDAREMFWIFKNQCYQADTLLNEKATCKAILAYIDTCGNSRRTSGHQLKDSDRILFYFSGHGSLNPFSSRRNIPSEQRPCEFYLQICREKGDSGESELRSSVLLDRLVNTGAYQVIAIFDACEAGGQRPQAVPINAYYDRLMIEKGLFVLSSWERLTEEKMYSVAIKQGLLGWSDPGIDRNRDHAVDAFELIQYVNDQVSGETNGYGEPYRASVIYVGGGAMTLTVKP